MVNKVYCCYFQANLIRMWNGKLKVEEVVYISISPKSQSHPQRCCSVEAADYKYPPWEHRRMRGHPKAHPPPMHTRQRINQMSPR